MKPITAKRHVNPNHQHSIAMCRCAVLAIALLLPSVMFAKSWFTNQADVLYAPQLTIGYQYTSPKNSGLLTGWLPLYQVKRQVLFTELSGFDQSGSGYEGNAMLGYRFLANSHNMLGLHAGASLSNSANSLQYEEMIVGGQWWFNKFYVGGNAYAPFGTTSRTLNGGYETALAGMDGELGLPIFHSISLFAGGYYYHRNEFDSIAGPSVTLEYNNYPAVTALRRIRFYVSYRHDQVFDTQIWAGLQVSLSILTDANRSDDAVADHMTDIIRRQPAMITTDYKE